MFLCIGIVEVVIDLMLINIFDSVIVLKLCKDWFDLMLVKDVLVVCFEMLVG